MLSTSLASLLIDDHSDIISDEGLFGLYYGFNVMFTGMNEYDKCCTPKEAVLDHNRGPVMNWMSQVAEK